jgi:hypothetical protein
MRTSVFKDEHRTEASDMRGTERFALLLLRSAKLLADGVEQLCIVRDVSSRGVNLRIFHRLPPATDWRLETAAGDLIAMHHVWERDGEAGFHFDEPIDVSAFVAAKCPFSKRPVRLRVHHPATLFRGGQELQAVIHDISRQGARIETATRLAVGQTVQLKARGLPDFEATVRWRREPCYGLVFARLMTLEELAQRCARLSRPISTEWRNKAPRS